MFLLWLFKVSGILRFSAWSLNEAVLWVRWGFCSHEKSTDIIASRKMETLGIYCLEVYQIYRFPWSDCPSSAGGDLEVPGGWIVPSSRGAAGVRSRCARRLRAGVAAGLSLPSGSCLKSPGRPILSRLCRCGLFSPREVTSHRQGGDFQDHTGDFRAQSHWQALPVRVGAGIAHKPPFPSAEVVQSVSGSCWGCHA